MKTEATIEKNILECFSFILNLEFILGANRVSVKDGVVRSPSDWQNLYSFFFFLGSTFSQLYYQYYYYSGYVNNKDTLLYVTNAFGQLTPYISYVTSVLVARFRKQRENIEIFTKLQNIDGILGLQHDQYFTRFQAKLQNFLVILLIVIFPTCVVIYAIEVVEKPIYTLFAGPSYMTVYVDFILFGAFMYYICIRLNILMKLLKNFVCRLGDEPQGESPFLIRLVLYPIYPNFDRIGEQSTLEPQKWVKCIEELLKAYQMITYMFRYQILNVTATLFLWSFLAIGDIASAFDTQTFTFIATILTGVWIIFFLGILTAGASLNDWFLCQVKHTKLLCVRIMYYDYDDVSRKAASRILKTVNQTDPKFVVYDVFTLNTGLLLTFVGVMATNVVVIIQFFVSKD